MGLARGSAGALPLTLAVGAYDHVRALLDGEVEVEGVELRPETLPVEQIFARSLAAPQWDVFELSMAHLVRLAGPDSPFVGIPVFTSRMFRQGAIHVREGSGILAVSDLAGARVGVPEWVQTAGVYARGLLTEAGVDTDSVDWLQAPLVSGGGPLGEEGPTPLRVEGSGATLAELLRAGRIEAMISARPPAAVEGEGPRLVPLSGAGEAAERAYYERTGIFPVMHALALRRELAERHPWLGASLVAAFEASKQRSLQRLGETALSWYPVPWLATHLAETASLFGGDPWPYGVGPNRVTLEVLTRYCGEQGIVAHEPRLEQLFPLAETHS